MRPDELERRLRERLDALGRTALLAILEMPEDTLGKSRIMCELLIDCKEDRELRAVLVEMLRGGRALKIPRSTASRRARTSPDNLTRVPPSRLNTLSTV